jgi:hypothetical protein
MTGIETQKVKVITYAVSGGIYRWGVSRHREHLPISADCGRGDRRHVDFRRQGRLCRDGGRGVIVTTIDSMLQIVHIAEAGRNIINGVIILLLLSIYGRKRNAGK